MSGPFLITPVRALLVDDDEPGRRMMRELLEDEGVQVVGEAGDGVEGVALALELEPDVVLMDLRMPLMDGFEATRLIKESRPVTQVIILTAYQGSLPEKSAEDAGAYAYLVKGCSPKFVKTVLTQARNFKAGMEQLGADRFGGGL
jgi:CheY-like chemotaxis protein